ncbi:hypothetical protein R1flu_025021 [Riccia fluitans]|uniref:Uncharacterized protein n=1 Tax=Riccia fluitans TaxID=41844 RepID=A0ABD1XWL5_9MARC
MRETTESSLASKGGGAADNMVTGKVAQVDWVETADADILTKYMSGSDFSPRSCMLIFCFSGFSFSSASCAAREVVGLRGR